MLKILLITFRREYVLSHPKFNSHYAIKVLLFSFVVNFSVNVQQWSNNPALDDDD